MSTWSMIARVIAGLDAFALPIAAFFSLNTSSLPLPLFCILMGPVIGLIELPSCCACFAWCKVLARYLKYVAGWWWIRGAIYIGLSAGGYAIYQIENQPQSTGMYMLICIIGMTGAAVLYFVATFRGEVNPAYVLLTKERAKAAEAAAKHPNDTDGASAPPANGWGWFGARNKEEAVGKAVIAAAPSMGKQLFGSSGDPKPVSAPQHAFSEAAPTAPPAKASLFGGGLFGGGSASKSSKYGYGDDVPEANPFV